MNWSLILPIGAGIIGYVVTGSFLAAGVVCLALMFAYDSFGNGK